MHLHTKLISAGACALAFTGCALTRNDDAAAAPTASSKQALSVDNGGNLNGGNLNGGNLNGGNLNGGNLNGNDLSEFLVSVGYLPASLNGTTALDSLHLEATRFVGQSGATVYTDTDFIGTDFQGHLGNGTPLTLRVVDMTPAPAPNADLWLYDVQYQADDGEWYPACRDYTGTPVLAMPLEGVWDYTQGTSTGGVHTSDSSKFTFACVGGAISKCTLWGYRPWATHSGQQLGRYHQACTRLVRGDYCGDGLPHTQNGNQVNLYDDLGIQHDTENWFFEANWDENGARCIFLLNRSHQGILPCIDLRLQLLCGLNLTQPGLGALLHSETPTGGL